MKKERNTHLLVILFQSGKILASLGKLALLHAFTDIPVDKGTLGVHEVELVVNARERFGNGGSVGHHAHSALDTGEITTRNDSRRLVVDTALETGGAPIDKLNGALGLDRSNGRVNILGNNVTTVHEAASHVLSVARITLRHHPGGLKDRVCNLGNRKLFVEGFLGGDDRSVRGEHEMNAGVGHQVGLELGDIYVKGTIETKRGCKRRDYLSDEAVEVGVRGTLNVKVATAYVIESLVVKAESAVGVLQKGVGGKNGVIGLHDGRRNLGRRRDSKGELRLASVVHGEPLK
jgi:hypothetical protein